MLACIHESVRACARVCVCVCVCVSVCVCAYVFRNELVYTYAHIYKQNVFT